MKEYEYRVKAYLKKDMKFVFDKKNQENLDRILRKSGASMSVIENYLTHLNLSLAENDMIREIGNKTHEYRPDKRPRRWIYFSFLLISVFYALNIVQYYFIDSPYPTFIGLFFVFSGLFIQLLFISRNGNITRIKAQVDVIHDKGKLRKIRQYLEEFLPERNKKLVVYGLKFEIVDGSIIELVYDHLLTEDKASNYKRSY